MKIRKKLPSIYGVSAGNTASLDLPLGKTYESITLEYSGVTLEQLKNIRVVLNGKTIQEYVSGARLAAFNKFYGLDDNAGYLTLHFVRPEMANLKQRHFTAIPTGKNTRIKVANELKPIESFQLYFDVDAAAANPVVIAHASQSLVKPDFLGQFIKVKRYVHGANTVGQFEIDKIVRGPAIRAIHMIDSDDTNDTTPTKLEIEMDSYIPYEASRALAIEDQPERSMQAGMYSVDFAHNGDFGECLLTADAQDFRVRPTIAETGKLDVVVEYLDTFDGI